MQSSDNRFSHRVGRSGRFYCFSPEVMLATFIIEIATGLWIFYRYRASLASRLMSVLLFCLALFQVAEYMVCEGALGLSSLDWARIGYASITMLPPLGVHIGMLIAGKVSQIVKWTAYGSGVAFAAFFLFVAHGMQSQVCMGNYVIFQVAPASIPLYTLYYFGWLIFTVALLSYHARRIATKAKRDALQWLAIGYTAFIVPTILMTAVQPESMEAIPSIMCGFAVILALIILFKVAPLALEPNTPKKAR